MFQYTYTEKRTTYTLSYCNITQQTPLMLYSLQSDLKGVNILRIFDQINNEVECRWRFSKCTFDFSAIEDTLPSY